MHNRILPLASSLFLLIGQNTFADCSPEEIISLSASGYSKEEIGRLCSSKNTVSDDIRTTPVYKDVGMHQLPKGIKWDGRIVEAVSWSDNLGINYLIVTETGDFPVDNRQDTYCSDDGYCVSAKLYGYHFVVDGNGLTPLWRIQDFIKGCDADITVEYQQGSLEITDLDADGLSETTFTYRIACRGDVSPADMKLLMHEGEEKYAIRGFTTTPFGKGEMRIDPSFNNSPQAFRDYAVRRWHELDKEFFDVFPRSAN